MPYTGSESTLTGVRWQAGGRFGVCVRVLRVRASAHVSPPLPSGEGWGEGSPTAWTRPATLTLPLSQGEREEAERRRGKKGTHTRRFFDRLCRQST
jgi:hypothetical protein